MKIPKYITHPTLILIGAALLMYALWLKSPSASEINAPTDTKNLLDQNNMHQITDIVAGGYLIFDDVAGKWQLNHDKFKSMSAAKAEEIQDFFVGKFVKIDPSVTGTVLNLPLELYDSYCFSSNPQKRALSNQCPVMLEP